MNWCWNNTEASDETGVGSAEPSVNIIILAWKEKDQYPEAIKPSI